MDEELRKKQTDASSERNENRILVESSPNERRHNSESDELTALHAALTTKYHDIHRIGSGAQATMLRALDQNQNPVAIKVFDFHNARSFKDLELFEREQKTLASIHSCGVPAFIESIKSDRFSYIVEEFIDAPSLEKRMRDGKRYNMNEIITILKNAAAVLADIEDSVPPVIHRDIKPANILVGDDLSVHLVDFGVVAAKHQETFAMTFAGTAGYVAPEQLYGKVTTAADIYSLGVTILHLISDVSPCDMKKNNFVFDVDYYMPKNVPDWFVTLIKKMITPNQEERIQDGVSLRDYIEKEMTALSAGTETNDASEKKRIDKWRTDMLFLADYYDNPHEQLASQNHYVIKKSLEIMMFVFLIFIIVTAPTMIRDFDYFVSKVLPGFFEIGLPIMVTVFMSISALFNNNAASSKRSDTDLQVDEVNEAYKLRLLEKKDLPGFSKFPQYEKLKEQVFETDERGLELTPEDCVFLDHYLADERKLKPCICYEPDPEFSVKDFVISILYYIVTAVCILFVIPYLCDVSNTAYFFINTFALFLHARFYCRFFRYHLPRMRDVDYQRAFALFRRKFVMECREAIMAQNNSTMAENAPADERAFALFRQSFVTENREAIMAQNNSTVAENTLANETNSHETSDDKP